MAGRSSWAGMLVLVTARSSAATFPVTGVDSVPPVAGRAGRLRSLTDDAGARERGGPGPKCSVGLTSRGPSGHVDMADSAAGGQRRAPISVTTGAKNVEKLAGFEAIILPALHLALV